MQGHTAGTLERRSTRLTMQNYLIMVGSGPVVVRRRLLVDPSSKELRAKKVIASDSPESFSAAFSGLGHAILCALSNGPDYPSNVARKLHRYHQTVYYHMHRLERAGLIKRVGHEEIRGGRANKYALTTDGYAVEFGVGGEALPSLFTGTRSESLRAFFKEFLQGGQFNGWIVVGSPEPHGPNRTQSRDGHYAVQLGFALGQFVNLPRVFPVKLEVDIKSEKLEGSNLVIVGGPRTNTISAELNLHLPVRFSEENFWGAIVDDTGKRYFSELDALVAKIRNPWSSSNVCTIAAGLTGAATKAAIIGVTNMAEQVLEPYGGKDFAIVLRGVDLDGDGKVDSVEVLHRARL